MPRKKNSRRAHGEGSIRQRPDGKWEGRITVGKDPGTGKPIRPSFYGDTEADVRKQMTKVRAELDAGTYQEPSKLTVSAWLDIWTADYLGNVKQGTKVGYEGAVRKHLKPALGATTLQKLKAHHIQKLYNKLQTEGKAPKTIRNIHGALHKALDQAAALGYVRQNVSSLCTLPRAPKKEMNVLADDAVVRFLKAIEGHRYETIYYVDLFTGMRQGEILGLTWECVDFEAGTVLICKQLSQEKKKKGAFFIDTTKHDKVRKIKPAAVVMEKLRQRKAKQAADRLRAGPVWDNPWNLEFTNELGRYISHKMVRKPYKRIVAELGMPELRFHDLRHSYAVMALSNGDDVKTLQENLGHHTAAFTLDQYGHVSERMREESSKRMDQYIKSLNKA